MPAQGQAVADYTLGRIIGSGTSATVHLAQDRRDGSWVALKILRPDGDAPAREHQAAHARFLQEVDTAQRLRHPGIVAVHAAGRWQEHRWLAMELVPGTDLTHYTTSRRLLPPALVLKLGQRIAAALAHAHAAGVIHRDVKPSNVLVYWPGDLVKLTDFGLARTADAQATRTGVVLGSPAYLAPEQLAGAAADAKTDLYALGVVTFQLLCARLPFESTSMGALLQAVATQAAPDVRVLRPELPAPLARLLAALLQKSGADRPGSAAEVAEQFALLALAVPGHSQPPGAGPMSHHDEAS